jgi:energy-coupling factor transporter ATP-binding protein EcfA2
MMPAIQLEGMRFAYPAVSADTDAPWVIGGIDLSVEQGEWLAVMGANDSGKTTLCWLLAGLAPHLTGGQMEGQVRVLGLDTHEHPPPALAGTVGLLFQETEAQLFNPTVEAEIAWGLENLGLPIPEIQSRLDETLALLRLTHARHRVPGQLSGGEKKRVALASVLAMRPSVLILDEPVGGLDPAGHREVLEALSRLRRHSAVTIVMTETDPEATAAFADRLVVLERLPEQGARIGLEGPPRSLFRQVERLARIGVGTPQMAQIAATLGEPLNLPFGFLTVDEARQALEVYLV